MTAARHRILRRPEACPPPQRQPAESHPESNLPTQLVAANFHHPVSCSLVLPKQLAFSLANCLDCFLHFASVLLWGPTVVVQKCLSILAPGRCTLPSSHPCPPSQSLTAVTDTDLVPAHTSTILFFFPLSCCPALRGQLPFSLTSCLSA